MSGTVAGAEDRLSIYKFRRVGNGFTGQHLREYYHRHHHGRLLCHEHQLLV